MFSAKELELITECVIFRLIHEALTSEQKEKLNALYIKLVQLRSELIPIKI